MRVQYKLMPDGGFIAGDRLTGFTAYAYPTSESATEAKRNPGAVAREMLDRDFDFRLRLDSRFCWLRDDARAMDARNWREINAGNLAVSE